MPMLSKVSTAVGRGTQALVHPSSKGCDELFCDNREGHSMPAVGMCTRGDAHKCQDSEGVRKSNKMLFLKLR